MRQGGLPGHRLAVDRRQRAGAHAALQERAVVGAGAIIQAEVLLELAHRQGAGVERLGDVHIARDDAGAARRILQAGQIDLGLVGEAVEAPGDIQPDPAELGVVAVGHAALVVVEHGEVPVQAAAQLCSDRARVLVRGQGRCGDAGAQDRGQRGDGVGGGGHGPSQVRIGRRGSSPGAEVARQARGRKLSWSCRRNAAKVGWTRPRADGILRRPMPCWPCRCACCWSKTTRTWPTPSCDACGAAATRWTGSATAWARPACCATRPSTWWCWTSACRAWTA